MLKSHLAFRPDTAVRSQENTQSVEKLTWVNPGHSAILPSVPDTELLSSVQIILLVAFSETKDIVIDGDEVGWVIVKRDQSPGNHKFRLYNFLL